VIKDIKILRTQSIIYVILEVNFDNKYIAEDDRKLI